MKIGIHEFKWINSNLVSWNWWDNSVAKLQRCENNDVMTCGFVNELVIAV